ncbi:hypothetical protein GEV33_007792 [Tenebrio molitor]|uniref:Uncharacterized protein n=1 Tax=Tenebrio molitor TaxID=7067 RepID=A0A8J6HIM9_TENMO|nr:hypothetical protein GEV33_007792 [Tenebrio molitor]
MTTYSKETKTTRRGVEDTIKENREERMLMEGTSTGELEKEEQEIYGERRCLTERDVYGCDKCDCGATSNRTTSRDPCFVVVGAIYGRKLSLGGGTFTGFVKRAESQPDADPLWDRLTRDGCLETAENRSDGFAKESIPQRKYPSQSERINNVLSGLISGASRLPPNGRRGAGFTGRWTPGVSYGALALLPPSSTKASRSWLINNTNSVFPNSGGHFRSCEGRDKSEGLNLSGRSVLFGIYRGGDNEMRYLPAIVKETTQ